MKREANGGLKPTSDGMNLENRDAFTVLDSVGSDGQITGRCLQSVRHKALLTVAVIKAPDAAAVSVQPLCSASVKMSV